MGQVFSSVSEWVEETFSNTEAGAKLPSDDKVRHNRLDQVQLLQLQGDRLATPTVTATRAIDATRFAVGYQDGSVVVWSHTTAQLLHQLQPGTTDPGHEVTALAVSPDRSLLAVADAMGTMTIWAIETGALHKKVPSLVKGFPLRFLSMFSKAFPFASANNLASSVTLWTWQGAAGTSLPLPTPSDDRGAVYVEACAFLHSQFALVGTSRGGICTYRPFATQQQSFTDVQYLPTAHEAAVTTMLALPSKRVATGAADGSVIVWSPTPAHGCFEISMTFKFEPRRGIGSIRGLSKQGGRRGSIGSAGSSRSGKSKKSGGSSSTLGRKGNSAARQALRSSVNGNSGDGEGGDTDARAVHEIIQLSQRYLAVHVASGFAVLDLEAKRPALDRVYPKSATPSVMAIAPMYHGRNLVTAHDNGSIRTWLMPAGDVHNGPMAELPMHAGPILHLLACSPYCVATFGADRSQVVWKDSEVDTGVKAFWSHLQPDSLKPSK